MRAGQRRCMTSGCQRSPRNRPDIPHVRIERTRHLMDTRFQDALVEGYEHHIDSLALPDADDRHVLAAAIHSGARIIVTTNLRDFPASALAPFSIEACHPDAFILGLLKMAKAMLCPRCPSSRAFQESAI